MQHVIKAALVAQVVGRQFVGWEVSGSIPGGSRLSGRRPHLRPPGAGIGSRVAVYWMRKEKELSYKWVPTDDPLGEEYNKKIKYRYFLLWPDP